MDEVKREAEALERNRQELVARLYVMLDQLEGRPVPRPTAAHYLLDSLARTIHRAMTRIAQVIRRPSEAEVRP